MAQKGELLPESLLPHWCFLSRYIFNTWDGKPCSKLFPFSIAEVLTPPFSFPSSPFLLSVPLIRRCMSNRTCVSPHLSILTFSRYLILFSFSLPPFSACVASSVSAGRCALVPSKLGTGPVDRAYNKLRMSLPPHPHPHSPYPLVIFS